MQIKTNCSISKHFTFFGCFAFLHTKILWRLGAIIFSPTSGVKIELKIIYKELEYLKQGITVQGIAKKCI